MMKFSVVMAGSVLLVSACATSTPYEMSEETAAELAKFERTGDVRNCISLRSIDRIQPLDERNFLIHVGVNTYYLNEVSGSCNSAGRSGYRLQYSTSLSQLCRGEIIKVVDNSTGFSAGSCGLGSFEKLTEVEPEDAAE